MKRWLRLLAVCGLMLIGAGVAGRVMAEPRVDHVVYAEGETSEEAFVEKTYVYDDGENKATLVLLNATEFSLTIEEETKYGVYVRKGDIISLSLGGEGIEVQVNDITGTFGEPVVEPEENWFKKQWNTLVVPVLSGTLLSTLAIAAINVGITLIKNSALDKKILGIEARAEEKYQQTQESLVKIVDIMAKVDTIYTTVIKSGELNSQVKGLIVDKLNEMSTAIQEAVKNTVKINDLVKVNALLVELESKVAKQSKEIVKSGIAQDIEEITKLVRNI